MIRVGVVGGKGYAAVEAIRLLQSHPQAQLTAIMGRVTNPEPLYKYNASLRGVVDLPIEPIDYEALAGRCDAVILGLPHAAAHAFAPGLIAKGLKVIDLSADFRFDVVETFEKTYDIAHDAKELNAKFPYALPELFRSEIAHDAPGLACPGCYPTSALLGLAPVMGRGDIVDLDRIVINSLSGVSGAGRTPSDTVHFCAVNESVMAYKVGCHRHRPEIEEKLGKLAGRDVKVTFTPHLIPVTRGILTTITVPLKQSVDTATVMQWYQDFYVNEPFVRIVGSAESVQIAGVALTNFCDLGVVADNHSSTLIISSAIDNLIKGASGQAIQAMNALYGFPETMGLLPGAGVIDGAVAP